MDDDPVVRPDRVGFEPQLLADPGAEREPPGGVDAAAERREHAQAPVADLVAEALDHDRTVRGDDAGRVLLLAQELDEVAGGAAVEVVVALEDGRFLLGGPARERADGLAELLRAPDPVALPERDRAREPGGGGDDHAVAGDLLDPPGARAEQERLPGARLVDHLLVELADAAAVGERHGVHAAVGDRAGVGDRELACARAGLDRAVDPVPDDPRA
jgi:hypothetical protein